MHQPHSIASASAAEEIGGSLRTVQKSTDFGETEICEAEGSGVGDSACTKRWIAVERICRVDRKLRHDKSKFSRTSRT